MTDDTRAEIRRVLSLITADMENDVRRDEGIEFSGRNVARSLGEIRAAICALARMIDLLNDTDTDTAADTTT